MKDITSLTGGDLVLFDTQTSKAKNVLQVQVGALEYAPQFGIDLGFFLNPALQFQNESFKSYLIQRLAEHHVNVNQVIDTLSQFFSKFTFVVGDQDTESGGFIK